MMGLSAIIIDQMAVAVVDGKRVSMCSRLRSSRPCEVYGPSGWLIESLDHCYRCPSQGHERELVEKGSFSSIDGALDLDGRVARWLDRRVYRRVGRKAVS
jgi:hypothetical protein